VTTPWRPSRRELLKVGLLGSLALTGAGYVGGFVARAQAAQGKLAFFRPGDEALARAVIRSFLSGILPAEPAANRQAVEESLATTDRYFAALSPATQGEAQQALGLMNLAPVRWLLGVWSPWASAGEAQVNAALEALRTSRLATARQIFQLLSAMATVGWYGQPASWAAIGYPGPPTVPRPRGEKPL
jgi:hypothetical protein